MASRSLGVAVSKSCKILLGGLRSQPCNGNIRRTITTNESGGVLDKPEQVRLGLVKLAVVVTPFMYAGSVISREFAAWLEEHELFVPDDDDDDD